MEKSLIELQEGVCKVQVAYDDDTDVDINEVTKDLNVIKSSASGRMHTLIIEGEREQTEEKIKQSSPVFMDFIPLGLEEIFINKLGGADDELKEIIL